MNKLIFAFLMASLIILPNVLSEECNYYTYIHLDIESIDEESVLSKYQFPAFRERDSLSIKKLYFENKGNYDLPEMYFSIKIYPIERGEIEENITRFYFCSENNRIVVPSLSVNETYEISKIQGLEYIDSLGENKFFCGEKLDNVGKWKIDIDWEDPNGIIELPYAIQFVVDGSYLTDFDVLSIYDTKNMENAEGILLVQWVGIFFAIAIPIIILVSQIHRENSIHKDKQVGLLKNIILRINLIVRDLKGFKEETIIHNKPYCPYDIKYINSDFYEANLDNKINKKPTEKIKEKLIWIDDKIKLINQYNRTQYKNQSEATVAMEASIKIIDEELMKKLRKLKKEIKAIF